MKSKSSVSILAPHYRENVDALKKCPIVLSMLSDIQGIPTDIKQKFVDQQMMSAVNAEYHKRGGNNMGSLGAVGWAISELLEGI